MTVTLAKIASSTQNKFKDFHGLGQFQSIFKDLKVPLLNSRTFKEDLRANLAAKTIENKLFKTVCTVH